MHLIPFKDLVELLQISFTSPFFCLYFSRLAVEQKETNNVICLLWVLYQQWPDNFLIGFLTPACGLGEYGPSVSRWQPEKDRTQRLLTKRDFHIAPTKRCQHLSWPPVWISVTFSTLPRRQILFSIFSPSLPPFLGFACRWQAHQCHQ